MPRLGDESVHFLESKTASPVISDVTHLGLRFVSPQKGVQDCTSCGMVRGKSGSVIRFPHVEQP